MKPEKASGLSGAWPGVGAGGQASSSESSIGDNEVIDSGIRCALLVVAVLAGGTASAQSPDTDIEAVQRKLDAAKQAQAAKDVAAKREADKRAAAAAAQVHKSTMIVKSDTRCELIVNGESQGWLEAEAPQRIKVDAGEQLIECDTGDGRKVEQTEEIDGGKQSVVRLTMPLLERFTKVAKGILDHEQQLIWSSSDNGGDVNIADAQRYCAAKGSGWTLPTVAALQSLYDASGSHGFSWAFANQSWTIKPATPLIHVSTCCLWSSESNGSSETYCVSLFNAHRFSLTVGLAGSNRALCVAPAF